ncbi:MAG: exosortase/archaeosortase family protein, partial [Myxococcota bacterium]
MNESSALEASTLERLAPWLWGALTLAVGLWIFFPILIWDVDPDLWSLPEAWLADENYSYGFLIPPLAAYFVWENQYRLRGLPLESSLAGLAVIAIAFLVFSMGMLGGINYLPRAAAVILLMGGVLWIAGWRWARELAFPIFFLLLMIPIPRFAMIQIAFPLQVFAAEMAQRILFEVGVPILRTGNVIHLAHVDLDVAEACSGLHSLLALITTGVVFAYFFGRSLLQRAVVVGMSIPIAI